MTPIRDSLVLVDHVREFTPAYRLPGGWITCKPCSTLREAMLAIHEMRTVHGFTYTMRITQTKTSKFIVY